jgi:ABC-type uncharacterized transport system YnjBCD ATPase subunit
METLPSFQRFDNLLVLNNLLLPRFSWGSAFVLTLAKRLPCLTSGSSLFAALNDASLEAAPFSQSRRVHLWKK